MGKKSKKKGGAAAKKKPNRTLSPKPSSSVPKKKLDSDQISLYRIYKYCTEAVIEWGKATLFKNQARGSPKIDKEKNQKASLSHVIFEILGGLADDGVLMPEAVFRDLKLAISYRKRVRRFYWSVPQVSNEDYARHEWLIQQLEMLAERFQSNKNQREEEPEGNGESAEVATREGFEVLALSDDEESVASTDSVAKTTMPVTILEEPPTPKELEMEERQFATALFVYELDSVRQNLRERWRKWAKQSHRNDKDAAKSLMAITASTEYSLSAVRKSALQMAFEIDNFSGFDSIIHWIDESSSASKQQFGMKDFKKEDLVTIVGLQKRPDLNGRQGIVAQPPDAVSSERLAVELFPAETDTKQKGKQTLSVQPKNLIFSDDTFLRLYEIHNAVGSLNVKTMDVPSTPPMIYGAPPSSSVQKAGIEVIMQGDKFEKYAKQQDYRSLLQWMVQYCFPLWISLSRYLPDAGAADAVFNAYVRNFASTGKLSFPLAFALLVALDGAVVCVGEGIDLVEEAKGPVVRVLTEAYSAQVYTPAIRLLERDGKKADCLYSHFDIARHMREEYSVAGMFFPLVLGELLLSGLRMHFVCSGGIPYAYVEKHTHVLHIYWMLRSEGYLGKIPELDSMVAMYRQRVFFRGGLAEKGQETYLKCQQLAQGVSLEAMRFLDGKAVPRRSGRVPMTREALSYEGLHVSEVSRLLDVLQWKSMPMVDKDRCLDEIEAIAAQEYTDIFTAPLLQVSVKVCTVASALEQKMTSLARESGPEMMAGFAFHTSRMTPIDLVSFWAMSLGDNRSVIPGEKDAMLSQFANIFSQAFAVEPTIVGEEPILTFSSNDHKVDSSLWGEKGKRTLANLHI